MNPKSFGPIANEHSRILILGTMPSVQSRKDGFYYSHPRNRFWQVLAGSLEQPIPQTVAEKTQLLLENNIALWDVLASCEITGSDDSSIRNPVYNDIASFLIGKPIEKILCNGAKAYKLCLGLGLALPVLCMPSTSPANASWSLERLTAAWKLTRTSAGLSATR
jgi:hypoxanthine-DNA glycosylase